MCAEDMKTRIKEVVDEMDDTELEQLYWELIGAE